MKRFILGRLWWPVVSLGLVVLTVVFCTLVAHAEVHRLDPRNEDRPHSLEAHRPDFPLTDLQVDGLWSYPDQPGGWAAPPVPVPEPSTLALVVLGAGALLLKWRVS